MIHTTDILYIIGIHSNAIHVKSYPKKPNLLNTLSSSLFRAIVLCAGIAHAAPNPGPGLGNLTYTNDELFNDISFINPNDGGDLGSSTSYGYNLAHMVNGYMVTVFAGDGGGVRGDLRGGIQFYDVSDPRNPAIVNTIWDPTDLTSRMREIHAMCFAQVGAQKLMLIPSQKGIQIWDVADVNAPSRVSLFEFVNGGDYTDTPWQLMWQHPYVYVATGGNGLYIIDVTDPAAPKLATRSSGGANPIPNGQLGGFNIGPIWAMGNRLIVTSMQSSSGFSVLDIAEPTEPQILATQGSIPEQHYAPGFDGKFLSFATRQTNAKTALYSIAADGSITEESHAASPPVSEQLYTSSQDNFVFLGCQSEIVKLDISDPKAPFIAGRGGLRNVSNPDFGQANPFGNTIMIGNDHGSGAGFMPHQTAPDTTAPSVTATSPAANELNVSTCSRVGIAFADNVELDTINTTNISVAPQINGSPGTALSGTYTLQFGIVNFTPTTDLEPNTTYNVTIKAGGVTDWVGNALSSDYQFSFRTGSVCAHDVISQPSALQHQWSFNGDADDSIGTLNGVLTGGVTISGGTLNLDGVDDFSSLPDTLDELQGTSSLSFFLATDQTGHNSPWLAPGVTGVEVAGTGDVFWGWLNASGHLCISANDGGVTTSSTPINDSVNRHFVLTRDSSTGAQQIYINGVLDASSVGNIGVASTPFSSLGRIEDTNADPNYLRGTLDEVRVFNYVLTTNDISTVYSQSQSNQVSHHWKLSSDYQDSIGSLHGTASGSPVHSEGGLIFDGTNDYLSLGGSHQTGPWSLSLFAKRTGTADEQIILNGSSGKIQLSQPGTSNKVGITNSGDVATNWNYSAPLNTWVHLVFVKESDNTTTLYADGVSQGNIAGWIDLPLATLGAAGSGSSSDTVSASDIPKAISDNSTSTSSLAVSALGGTLTDVNVTINITHTFVQDLSITLVHPDGTRIDLCSLNGGNGDNFTNTVFDQQASTSITSINSSNAPFTASYTPEGNLDSLNGKSANGTWTLEGVDGASGDTGSIDNWSLDLSTNASASASGYLAATLDDICVFPASIDSAGINQLRGGFSVSTTPPVTTELGNSTSFTGSASSGASEPSYVWDFGDGTVTTASLSAAVTHTYSNPGFYTVRLTASDRINSQISSFTHTVVSPLTAGKPVRSRTIAVDGNQAYAVNTDNDSITAVNGVFPFNKLWEQAAGDHPRSIAVSASGDLWVTNKEDATITVHDSATGTIIATHTLPRASRPHGLIIAPDNSAAYVSLEATGKVAKINLGTGNIDASADVGEWPRGLAMTHDSARLFVTRFISEDTGATITEINPSTLATVRTFTLAADTATVDDSFQARGVANYLNSITITPDGTKAWFPSKKDNIFRGTGRDGQTLSFETSIRPISSIIDIDTNNTAASQHIDFNDVGIPVDVEFSNNGSLAFVAIEGSNQVEIRDSFTGNRRGGTDNTGLTPRGLASNADGSILFVHHFMGRSVKVYDTTQIRDGIGFSMPLIGQIDTVSSEKLPEPTFTGKQIFYNAGDSRMSSDSYISCASCHDDGGHDGRTWDFTERGEGFRNTTTLRGRSGMGHGRVHWTANFDEIQDFEHDIRGGFGGSGFMSDTDFNTGTRNTTLGDPKAGVSTELDALAAYVASLDTIPTSPHKAADGNFTAEAARGREAFIALNCYTCHDTNSFTDSPQDLLHDVGTIQAHSGQRMGAALTGFDTPSLKGIWHTAPYLHDGSAATLRDVLSTRNPSDQHGAVSTLTATQVNELVAYLEQLDGDEVTADQYDRWKHDHYSLDQVLTGSVATKAGDDDSDGKNNFYEYVFGTNPNAALGDAAVTSVAKNPAGGFTLTFEIVSLAESEALIQCQSSTTLQGADWTNVTLSETGRVVTDDKTRITLQIPEPGEGETHKFYRLNVSP